MNEENIRLTYLSGKLPHGFCKGKTPISPMVPPISVISTLTPSPAAYILSLISFVTWGITCTVLRDNLPVFPYGYRFINLSTGEVIETLNLPEVNLS